jgi:transitional endoplasmic reticulum ATPase
MAVSMEAPKSTEVRPTWFNRMFRDYKAGMANVAVLHGGIFDNADAASGLTVRQYLAAVLSKRFVVASYSNDEGITFPNDRSGKGDRKAFDLLMGGAEPQPQQQGQSAAVLAAQAMMRGEAQGQESDLPKVPAEAIPLLVEFLRKNTIPEDDDPGDPAPRACVILDRVDLLCPPADKGTMPDVRLGLLGLLHRLGRDSRLNANGSLLILLTPTLEEIHPDLRASHAGIPTFEIEPPTFEQRLDFIRRVVAERDLTLEVSEATFASLTAGLFRVHIEDIGMRAEREGGIVTEDLVNERKNEQFKAEYSDVLRVIQPRVTKDQIGGHTFVWDYVMKMVLPAFIDEGKRKLADKGILLMGPAGTGKTIFAEALASVLGLPLVISDPDNIRGKYVGESQAKLAKMFSGIRALSPCILFIDEVDQKLRRGSGEGGGGGDQVESDIFAGFLQFLSDDAIRGRVLVVAATNYPDRLDPAFKRPGRFDVKLPMLTPDSETEVLQVMEAAMRKVGMAPLPESDLLPIARNLTDWTQAEIAGLITKGQREVEMLDEQPLAAIQDALANMRRATKSVDLMTVLALAECDDLRMVPPKYRDRLGAEAQTEVKRLRAEEKEIETGEPRRRKGSDIDL